MKSNLELDRRKVLGTVGGLAMAGSGLAALTGSVTAGGDASISDANLQAITTDDGEIQYVAYGGRLRYEWDGLDTEATHGMYILETRVHDGSSWSNWRHIGSDSGPLGENTDDGNNKFEQGEENTSATWGGTNDSNSGPGTDGFFQFKYGSAFNNPDYALAYTDAVANDPEAYGPEGLRLLPSDKAYNLAMFEAEEDGGTQRTVVEFRYTCRVYDGDPNDGGSVVGKPDKATARMPVEVTNRPATGDTGGDMTGSVGGDTS